MLRDQSRPHMLTHESPAMEERYVRRPVPGTAADDADMRRMHKVQELNVSVDLPVVSIDEQGESLVRPEFQLTVKLSDSVFILP